MTGRSFTLSEGERTAVTVLVTIGVAAMAVSWWTDRRLPTRTEWLIAGILATVAVAGALTSRYFGPGDAEWIPPWSVHSIWLVPAALTLPPAGFLPLVVLSLALGLSRRTHPLPTRLVVASITAISVPEIHAAALWIDNLLLAGLIGILAMHVTGLICAVVAQSVLSALAGAAIWMDTRWSAVQLGCSFAGLLTAAAIAYEPLAATTAIAPLLMAEFTMNWPELDRRARIDAKTGLPNARHWEDRSRELIAAAAARSVPVAIAMIDIDHFKNVNDSYGHLVGDEVLQSLAATLRTQVNPGDVIGRFGGEEFVITLFGLGRDGLQHAAERIRAAVAAQVHSSRARLTDDPAAFGSDGAAARAPATFGITCTIGLAASDGYGYDLSALLAIADDALASGKSAGRDRVVVG